MIVKDNLKPSELKLVLQGLICLFDRINSDFQICTKDEKSFEVSILQNYKAKMLATENVFQLFKQFENTSDIQISSVKAVIPKQNPKNILINPDCEHLNIGHYNILMNSHYCHDCHKWI